MSRNKGTFDFSANLEVRARAPLDPKTIVETKADLLNPTIWQSNAGDEWTYPGMIVSVWNDTTPNNNGIYRLKASDYTVDGNWENLGTSSLSTALSTEVYQRTSSDQSLSTAISGLTEDITNNVSQGQIIYYTGTTLSGTTNLFPSLSTAISTVESTISTYGNIVPYNIWIGTQAQYNGISPKLDTTLYYITS